MSKTLFACALALVFSSSSCSTAKAGNTDEHYMDCMPLSNSMNKNIQRCVNDEAVCYISDVGQISCMSK